MRQPRPAVAGRGCVRSAMPAVEQALAPAPPSARFIIAVVSANRVDCLCYVPLDLRDAQPRHLCDLGIAV